MSNQWVVVALDTGNGNGNIYSDEVRGETISAVLGRYTEANKKGKGDAQKRDIYKVESDDQLWAIGQDVYDLRLKPLSIVARDGMQRYTQPLFKVYSKILLAKAIGKKRPAPSNVLLLTTTTARDFQDGEIHDVLQDLFVDPHKVAQNGEKMIITVQRYEPMSETEAVIYDFLLDEEGSYADESILEKDILVINPGYGTTDIAHFRGNEYIPDIIKETIEMAYKDIVDRLSIKVGKVLKRTITPEDINTQLDTQREQEEKTFNFYGENVDGFNDMYYETVDAVFADLIAEINGVVPDTGRFHIIAVVGGCAEATVWAKHFKKWNERKVQIPEKPSLSPVRGMYKWGRLEADSLAAEEAAATKE